MANDKTDNKKKLMIQALTKALGVVTVACKSVGINRDTHYRWLKEDAEYKAEVKDLDNVALDFAENALHKLMEKGEVSAIIFYLKTKGKQRGFIERQELQTIGELDIIQPGALQHD